MCVCLCPCVHTFKHAYLRDQWADRNQILSKAALRWGGKAALGFWPDRIRTLVSMTTDSSYRVMMEKTFSRLFFIRSFVILAGNEDMHESLKEFEVGPDPTNDY